MNIKVYVASLLFMLPVLASLTNKLLGNLIAIFWAWFFFSMLIEFAREKEKDIEDAVRELKRREAQIAELEAKLKKKKILDK